MLKKLNIKARLITAFVIVTLLASVAGILSIFVMQDMDTNYSEALEDYGFAQGDIGRAMNLVTDNRRLVRDIISLDNKEKLEADVQQIEMNRKKYDEYAAEIEKSLVSEEAKQAYAEVEKALAEYQALQDKMIQTGLQANAEEKAALVEKAIDEIDPVYDKVYAAYTNIMDIKVNRGDDLSVSLSKRADWSMIIVVVLIVIAVWAGVTIGIVVARGLSKPIIKCVKRLDALAAGDLRAEVPQVNTNDETKILADATAKIVDTMTIIVDDMRNELQEIGKGNFQSQSKAVEAYVGDYNPLFVAIEKIADELSVLMTEVNDSSEQVEMSSSQVSDAAQSLSQGATEQASSVEELSATLEELSGKITVNAQHAENARIETEQVNVQIVDSNKQMQSMIEAMNKISDKSNEIGKIIKTIDDIAFQTNILALNAAVEAARAGEAGKGFAVVADEVRNLAGKSAEAAKNTEALIEETIEAVEQGAAMADSTAKSMMTVVEGAEKITTIVDQIATASGEQAGAVGQVTQAVGQISSVVQNNAATAEETAAASETLNGQAQGLKNLVARFKVRENTVMGVQSASSSVPKPFGTSSETHSGTKKKAEKKTEKKIERKAEKAEQKTRLPKPDKKSKPIARKQPEEKAEIVMPEEHIPEFVEPETSVPKASFGGGFNSSFDKY